MNQQDEEYAIHFFGAIAAAIRAGELPLQLAVALEGETPARLWKHINFEIGGAGLTTSLMPYRAGEAVMRVIERMTAIHQHRRHHMQIGSTLNEPVYQLDDDRLATDTARLTADTLLLRRLWDGPFDADQAKELEQRYKTDLWKYKNQAFLEAIHLISYFRDPAIGLRRSVTPQQPMTFARGGDEAARRLAWDVFHLAEDAGVDRDEIMSILRDFGPPSAQEAMEAAMYNARFNRCAVLICSLEGDTMPQNPWAVVGIGLFIGATGTWLYKRHRRWLEIAAVLPLIPP